MTAQSLGILQVNTFDRLGGAGNVAWNLFRSYRKRGYGSELAVKHKLSDDPDVWEIPNLPLHRNWTRFWLGLHSQLQLKKQSHLGALLTALAEPERALDFQRGIEDLSFPGTWQLLHLARQRSDIVHCHNLHGGYFDLRVLPGLSRQVPVVLTLHDAWMLSGHCAHSFDCERWKIGCGHCPDLTIDPPIRRDATAYNWQRKRTIYAKSRLAIATPSRWLMQKVEQSILATGMIDARVIPNGVDLSVFHPADKANDRAMLNIPQDIRVIFFAAYDVTRNRWKDYATIRSAVTQVAQMLGENVLFIALGEENKEEHVGFAQIRFVPYEEDSLAVARYYQAADVYAHAARADTFPNTVLEALACGTPVVATAVGGIPEQIEDGHNGFLVSVGDAQALAERLLAVLTNNALRQRMSECAATNARRRFDLDRQVDTYLAWYHELVESTQHALSKTR